jgi:hypothetical protein
MGRGERFPTESLDRVGTGSHESKDRFTDETIA